MTAQCNVQNMTTWVEALESGDYLQGNGQLFDGTGHCCLGVLHAIQGGTFVEHAGDIDDPVPWGTEDGDVAFPSVATVAWLGLDEDTHPRNVRVRDVAVDGPFFASKENDKGTTFAGIAALLRARYLPTEVTS